MGRKKISVLGDSVSTFQDYTPEGFVFYGPWNAEYTGVESVEDTWWMKVIRKLDGCLLKNNSLSGSLVAGRSVVSGTSEKRIAALGNVESPDMILVAMGANDWGFGFLPEEFESEYRRMLHLLKKTYPRAEIYCATLPEARIAQEDEMMFFDVDNCISKKVYSNIIRRAVLESELHLVDLYASGRDYSSIDGIHPDKEGMQDLYEMWISEMK